MGQAMMDLTIQTPAPHKRELGDRLEWPDPVRDRQLLSRRHWLRMAVAAWGRVQA